MKLVLKYYVGGLNAHFSWVTAPLEADSKEDASAAFRAALGQAMAQGDESFVRWGVRHYLYNFMTEVDTQRLRYLQRQAELNHWPAPVVAQYQGRWYLESLPKFLTVDEWFDEARSAPAALEGSVCAG